MSVAVSILVPAYNAEDYIAETVASIKSQTLNKFEAIFVNDGSSDSTVEALESAINGDPRFTIIHKPHSNLIDTLNLGLKECNGDWIARLDADDVMHPQRLECQYRVAQQYPNTVLLASKFLNFSANEVEKTAQDAQRLFLPEEVCSSPLSKEDLLSGNIVGHPTVMLKRSAIRSTTGYDSRYIHAEDYEYWLRLSKFGEARLIDAELTFRRIHSANISRNHAGTQLFSSAVARAIYRLNKAKQPPPKLGETLDNAAFELTLPRKILGRYSGEKLSIHCNKQQHSKALTFWWWALRARPYAALSALRYGTRHYRTGTVLKRWGNA